MSLRAAIAVARAKAELEQLFIYGPYRALMRLAHRFNWHYAPPHEIEGDTLRRCSWCGLSHVQRAVDPSTLLRTHTSPPESDETGAADPAPAELTDRARPEPRQENRGIRAGLGGTVGGE